MQTSLNRPTEIELESSLLINEDIVFPPLALPRIGEMAGLGLALDADGDVDRILKGMEENGFKCSRIGDVYYSIDQTKPSKPHIFYPKKWIAKLDPTEDPSHAAFRHINRLHPCSQLDLLGIADLAPVMHERCRLTICIPIAAEEELSTIIRTLENLARQTASPESFEVIAYYNFPDDPKRPIAENYIGYIQRAEELCRAIQNMNCPELRISVFGGIVPQEILSIGYVRSTLNSVAIARYLRRGPDFPNHLLMRADADMEYIEPTMVESVISNAWTDPNCVNYIGDLTPHPTALIEDPALAFGYSIYKFAYHYMIETGVHPCGGPHATTWLTSYVQSCGYAPWQTCGEDVKLDKFLSALAARSGEYMQFKFLPKDSLILTDTRRAEVALALGISPAKQWSPKVAEFSASNPHIRNRERVRLGNFEDIMQDVLLRNEAEEFINQTVSVFLGSEILRSQPKLNDFCVAFEREYGISLEIVPEIGMHINELSFRFRIKDRSQMLIWMLNERMRLKAEMKRIKSVNPDVRDEMGTLASGLKYSSEIG